MDKPFPLIRMRGVYKKYLNGDTELHALKNVNIDIFPGDYVAIIGPSGSGKSTLMNILGALDAPDEGTLIMNGVDIANADKDMLAHYRREFVGFIFQSYNLLPHLNAEENVALPALYAKQNPEQEGYARVLLEHLGLGDRMRHVPYQLSGGQQQRVSIARALMNNPDIILADEPTGALDKESSENVLSVLEGLHHKGHTVVIVTHDANIARMAKRIIRIEDGEVISDRRNDTQNETAKEFSVCKKPGDGNRNIFSFIFGSFWMAWKNILYNPLRTCLTMLGIIIGISSVITIHSLGEGAKAKVVSDVNSLGGHSVTIYPGKHLGDKGAKYIKTLSQADALYLATLTRVEAVSPYIYISDSVSSDNYSAMTSVNGVGLEHFRIFDRSLLKGRFFNDFSLQNNEQVAIIDEQTADILFPGVDDATGSFIKIGGRLMKVIGIVTDSKIASLTGGSGLAIFIPYTTAMRKFRKQDHLDAINLSLSNRYERDDTLLVIENLIMHRHQQKDFYFYTADSIVNVVKQVTNTLTWLILAIAFVSLTVGGIGVMNMMLVSVTERTREIGIRMAVGARQFHIMIQFLSEAVLICLMAGAIGVISSFTIITIFQQWVSVINVEISMMSVVVAFLSSSLTGVIFGIMPALKASRLNPIAALHY